MKKGFLFLLSAFVLALTVSCGDDDSKTNGTAISVSFANQSTNITAAATPIQIVFSAPASSAGQVTVQLAASNVVYGTDFTTTPAATGNTVVVPFNSGATGATFTLNNLADLSEEQIGSVTFTISNISINGTATGITSTLVNFYEAASSGAAIAALTGGPNQPNQVYVDLSGASSVEVPRVSWDLGFSSTDNFRLVLNGSLKMAAKALSSTNIDEVVQEDSALLFGQGAGSPDIIDDPSGDITKTVIKEVSTTDSENPVYLVNLGNGPSASTPAIGTEGSAAGVHRGWKKIRILRSGNDYVLQYADINATTHQEVTITKNAAFNFTFFSFTTNNVVNVEPQKNLWDINFTTFTNFVSTGSSFIPYYYADFIVTNVKGGARSYEVINTDQLTYTSFALSNVDPSKFTEDQRNIGSNWRATSVTGSDGIPVSQFVIKTDRFYVVKDAAGNIYKLRLTQGTDGGVRGYPKFEYSLLK